MKILLSTLAVSLAIAFGVPGSPAAEAGKRVKLAEVAPAAQAAIKEEVAGGKIQEIRRKVDIGYNTLEVDYAKAGVERSFTVTSLGKVIERLVYSAEVPAPVQNSIKTIVTGGKLGDITWIDDEGDVFYFVEYEKGGVRRAVSLALDGKVLSLQVTLAETPAPVQKGIKEKVGDGHIDDIDKSDDDGDISFDVNYHKGKSQLSFTIDEDGDLVSEQVARNEVSEAVQKTIREQVGKDRFKRLDKVVDEDVPYYQVEVIRGGKKSAFKISMEGKYLGPGEP